VLSQLHSRFACFNLIGATAVAMAGGAALTVEPAAGARPVAGAHYLGFVGDETQVNDIPGLSAELRVSRDRRSFSSSRAGSYVKLTITCARDTNEYVYTTLRLASARRQVRIGRGGQFRLAGRRGQLRYRLRGRFVVAGEARIAWRARTPPHHPKHRRHPGICKDSRIVTLYRNGQPPFSGCRSQRAKTLVEGPTGRVFEQYKPNGPRQWIPHVFACLFATNKRYHLGLNWDETRLDVFRLAGPFVGYSPIDCGPQGPCFGSIRVKDLRTGERVVDEPPPSGDQCYRPGFSSSPSEVQGLVLKDNGSVAWIVRVYDGQGYREVCAFDSSGRRQLDLGNGIDTKSLKLSDSTITWVKDGTVRSATLQ
jgi:hypothetical protein